MIKGLQDLILQMTVLNFSKSCILNADIYKEKFKPFVVFPKQVFIYSSFVSKCQLISERKALTFLEFISHLVRDEF